MVWTAAIMAVGSPPEEVGQKPENGPRTKQDRDIAKTDCCTIASVLDAVAFRDRERAVLGELWPRSKGGISPAPRC
jgi:hypothetical protein